MSLYFRRTMIAILTMLLTAASSWAGKINEHWTVTFNERFRLVTWDNAITLDETANGSRTFTRSRTRLGATWTQSENLTVTLRLANEFRYHLTPPETDFHLNETFIDHLYLKIKPPFYPSITLTVGRQDIMLGEGFIVMDGHPLDGSRSIYFNAVRLDWTLRPDHGLTAFASFTEEYDDWLPIFHKVDQILVEQPETGIGVYYFGRWCMRDIQGYFVHKHRGENESIPNSSTANTLGSRITQPFEGSAGLAVVVEAGYQFGENGDADHAALGGYGYFQAKPKWTAPRPYLPARITVGTIYLSGDDPDTEDWEGWDPMFARWPKWSESYIYTQVKEDAVAWWTNLISIYSEVQFNLTPNVDFKLTCHHLIAPQAADTSTGFPGGSGKTRGELIIGKLTYKFGHHWSGHVLCEAFNPGDYYFDGADSYAWIRTEFMFRY